MERFIFLKKEAMNFFSSPHSEIVIKTMYGFDNLRTVNYPIFSGNIIEIFVLFSAQAVVRCNYSSH